MKLVFATHNRHKLEEVQQMLGKEYKLLGLADIGCHEEIPEPYETLEENAREKAAWVFRKYGYDCFADDTGLEVHALGGKPGVYSARYAGDEKDFESNTRKVLEELKEHSDRSAQFRTVIQLLGKNVDVRFQGTVKGKILHEKRGSAGFGYDPVFIPDGYELSFAEMDIEEKNKISHRGIAFRKLTSYLKYRTEG